VIWRDGARWPRRAVRRGDRFSPDKKYFVPDGGERQRNDAGSGSRLTAGQILRLTLDGKPAPGNPQAGKHGAVSSRIIGPPRNTEIARPRRRVQYTFPGPNLTESETWTTGHLHAVRFWRSRSDGRCGSSSTGHAAATKLTHRARQVLWLAARVVRHELRCTPIPSPDTGTDLAKPVIYWTPVIASGNFVFYSGAMFPQWNGSRSLAAWRRKTLSRVTSMEGRGDAGGALGCRHSNP